VNSQADWFEVREFEHGVFGIGEPGHDENVKSFLVIGNDQAMLVDTGTGVGNIKQVVDGLTNLPVLLVNSHGHWDHVGGDWRFDRIWIHEAEADDLRAGVSNQRMRRFVAPARFTSGVPDWIDIDTITIPGAEPERTLSGGERIDIGGREFLVVITPGHSPGGITLVEESTGIALVGDAVYAGALYGHLDHSDPRVYRDTLKRLADLASSLTAIYPCHDNYPLEPSFLIEVHEGYELVWNGRKPDSIQDGVEHYEFDRFSVLLREGWRG
jgi:glyoxylase-like metal-dependent hydrolase (beta-lactamase superfamily II)